MAIRRLATGLAVLALAVPAVLVGRAMTVAGNVPEPIEAIEWRAPPPLGAAMTRPLLTVADAEGGPVEGAPELLGIAGRLNVDAVALVRGSDGTRALKPGEGIDGWQLRSLSADAAYFTRGTQQARVPLANDEPPPDQ